MGYSQFQVLYQAIRAAELNGERTTKQLIEIREITPSDEDQAFLFVEAEQNSSLAKHLLDPSTYVAKDDFYNVFSETDLKLPQLRFYLDVMALRYWFTQSVYVCLLTLKAENLLNEKNLTILLNLTSCSQNEEETTAILQENIRKLELFDKSAAAALRSVSGYYASISAENRDAKLKARVKSLLSLDLLQHLPSYFRDEKSLQLIMFEVHDVLISPDGMRFLNWLSIRTANNQLTPELVRCVNAKCSENKLWSAYTPLADLLTSVPNLDLFKEQISKLPEIVQADDTAEGSESSASSTKDEGVTAEQESSAEQELSNVEEVPANQPESSETAPTASNANQPESAETLATMANEIQPEPETPKKLPMTLDEKRAWLDEFKKELFNRKNLELKFEEKFQALTKYSLPLDEPAPESQSSESTKSLAPESPESQLLESQAAQVERNKLIRRRNTALNLLLENGEPSEEPIEMSPYFSMDPSVESLVKLNSDGYVSETSFENFVLVEDLSATTASFIYLKRKLNADKTLMGGFEGSLSKHFENLIRNFCSKKPIEWIDPYYSRHPLDGRSIATLPSSPLDNVLRTINAELAPNGEEVKFDKKTKTLKHCTKGDSPRDLNVLNFKTFTGDRVVRKITKHHIDLDFINIFLLIHYLRRYNLIERLRDDFFHPEALMVLTEISIDELRAMNFADPDELHKQFKTALGIPLSTAATNEPAQSAKTNLNQSTQVASSSASPVINGNQEQISVPLSEFDKKVKILTAERDNYAVNTIPWLIFNKLWIYTCSGYVVPEFFYQAKHFGLFRNLSERDVTPQSVQNPFALLATLAVVANDPHAERKINMLEQLLFSYHQEKDKASYDALREEILNALKINPADLDKWMINNARSRLCFHFLGLLTEGQWCNLQKSSNRFFQDVARDIDAKAREIQARHTAAIEERMAGNKFEEVTLVKKNILIILQNQKLLLSLRTKLDELQKTHGLTYIVMTKEFVRIKANKPRLHQDEIADFATALYEILSKNLRSELVPLANRYSNLARINEDVESICDLIYTASPQHAIAFFSNINLRTAEIVNAESASQLVEKEGEVKCSVEISVGGGNVSIEIPYDISPVLIANGFASGFWDLELNTQLRILALNPTMALAYIQIFKAESFARYRDMYFDIGTETWTLGTLERALTAKAKRFVANVPATVQSIPAATQSVHAEVQSVPAAAQTDGQDKSKEAEKQQTISFQVASDVPQKAGKRNKGKEIATEEDITAFANANLDSDDDDIAAVSDIKDVRLQPKFPSDVPETLLSTSIPDRSAAVTSSSTPVASAQLPENINANTRVRHNPELVQHKPDLFKPYGLSIKNGLQLEEDHIYIGLSHLHELLMENQAKYSVPVMLMPFGNIHGQGKQFLLESFPKLFARMPRGIALQVLQVNSGHYVAVIYNHRPNENSLQMIIVDPIKNSEDKVKTNSALAETIAQSLPGMEFEYCEAGVSQQLNTSDCGFHALHTLFNVQDDLQCKTLTNRLLLLTNDGQIRLYPMRLSSCPEYIAIGKNDQIQTQFRIRNYWTSIFTKTKFITAFEFNEMTRARFTSVNELYRPVVINSQFDFSESVERQKNDDKQRERRTEILSWIARTIGSWQLNTAQLLENEISLASSTIMINFNSGQNSDYTDYLNCKNTTYTVNGLQQAIHDEIKKVVTARYSQLKQQQTVVPHGVTVKTLQDSVAALTRALEFSQKESAALKAQLDQEIAERTKDKYATVRASLDVLKALHANLIKLKTNPGIANVQQQITNILRDISIWEKALKFSRENRIESVLQSKVIAFELIQHLKSLATPVGRNRVPKSILRSLLNAVLQLMRRMQDKPEFIESCLENLSDSPKGKNKIDSTLQLTQEVRIQIENLFFENDLTLLQALNLAMTCHRIYLFESNSTEISPLIAVIETLLLDLDSEQQGLTPEQMAAFSNAMQEHWRQLQGRKDISDKSESLTVRVYLQLQKFLNNPLYTTFNANTKTSKNERISELFAIPPDRTFATSDGYVFDLDVLCAAFMEAGSAINPATSAVLSPADLIKISMSKHRIAKVFAILNIVSKEVVDNPKRGLKNYGNKLFELETTDIGILNGDEWYSRQAVLNDLCEGRFLAAANAGQKVSESKDKVRQLLLSDKILRDLLLTRISAALEASGQAAAPIRDLDHNRLSYEFSDVARIPQLLQRPLVLLREYIDADALIQHFNKTRELSLPGNNRKLSDAEIRLLLASPYLDLRAAVEVIQRINTSKEFANLKVLDSRIMTLPLERTFISAEGHLIDLDDVFAAVNTEKWPTQVSGIKLTPLDWTNLSCNQYLVAKASASIRQALELAIKSLAENPRIENSKRDLYYLDIRDYSNVNNDLLVIKTGSGIELRNAETVLNECFEKDTTESGKVSKNVMQLQQLVANVLYASEDKTKEFRDLSRLMTFLINNRIAGLLRIRNFTRDLLSIKEDSYYLTHDGYVLDLDQLEKTAALDKSKTLYNIHSGRELAANDVAAILRTRPKLKDFVAIRVRLDERPNSREYVPSELITQWRLLGILVDPITQAPITRKILDELSANSDEIALFFNDEIVLLNGEMTINFIEIATVLKELQKNNNEFIHFNDINPINRRRFSFEEKARLLHHPRLREVLLPRIKNQTLADADSTPVMDVLTSRLIIVETSHAFSVDELFRQVKANGIVFNPYTYQQFSAEDFRAITAIPQIKEEFQRQEAESLQCARNISENSLKHVHQFALFLLHGGGFTTTSTKNSQTLQNRGLNLVARRHTIEGFENIISKLSEIERLSLLNLRYYVYAEEKDISTMTSLGEVLSFLKTDDACFRWCVLNILQFYALFKPQLNIQNSGLQSEITRINNGSHPYANLPRHAGNQYGANSQGFHAVGRENPSGSRQSQQPRQTNTSNSNYSDHVFRY